MKSCEELGQGWTLALEVGPFLQLCYQNKSELFPFSFSWKTPQVRTWPHVDHIHNAVPRQMQCALCRQRSFGSAVRITWWEQKQDLRGLSGCYSRKGEQKRYSPQSLSACNQAEIMHRNLYPGLYCQLLRFQIVNFFCRESLLSAHSPKRKNT